MNKAAKIFAALAEPTRLEILLQLSKRSGCVSGLQLKLNRSQPNISQHLRVLREAGLVKSRRDGKKVCYSLSSSAVARLISAAEKLGGREW
ncbi:MAG: metalloregulator ArsR/SmtB family transcription factor [Candidatus Anstonellaceae archaeon]